MGRALDRLPNDRCVIDHHDQDEDGRDESEAFEKDRERIGCVKIPEAAAAGDRCQEETGHEDRAEANHGGESQRAFVDLLGERFEKENEHAQDEHRDFECGRADRHHFGAK